MKYIRIFLLMAALTFAVGRSRKAELRQRQHHPLPRPRA